MAQLDQSPAPIFDPFAGRDFTGWNAQLQPQMMERETMGDLDEDDDSGDEDEDADDDEDEDDDEEKPKPKPKEKTPDELKAENARLARALRKANRRDAKLRHEQKAGGAKPKAKDDDEDDDDEKVERARSEGTAAGTKIAIRSEAKSALLLAGLNVGDDADTRTSALRKAIKLLDLDELTIDEDGDVEGLEDQITELKEEFPELFRKKRQRRDINGGDDRGGSGKTGKTLSASERQAAMLKGKK